MNPMRDFAGRLRCHLSSWATTNGLAECVELDMGRPWVLAEAHRTRNLFSQEWWHHIRGFEHRWVRALNSSQCFAVNLFPSVDSSKPAIVRHFKTGHHGRGGRDPMEFYFVASSVRKSVWTLVRQLRGPHLRTCA